MSNRAVYEKMSVIFQLHNAKKKVIAWCYSMSL